MEKPLPRHHQILDAAVQLFSSPSPDCMDAHPSRPKSGQRLPQGWIMMVEVVWVCVSPGSNDPQKQPAERCHDGILPMPCCLQNSKASGWDYRGLSRNICPSFAHPLYLLFLDVNSRNKLIKAGHLSSLCWCEKLWCLILLHSSLCWSCYLTLDMRLIPPLTRCRNREEYLTKSQRNVARNDERTLDLWHNFRYLAEETSSKLVTVLYN